MPATLWSGTVSFGIVAIPVSLVSAAKSGRLAFHLLHDADSARLERRMRCTADGELVGPKQMVRGVEVEPGRHIVVTAEELEGLAVSRSRTIEIDEFVKLSQMPTIYYDRPYYLIPAGAEKPYRLLAASLRERQCMGLASFVLHTREHLVGLRALGDLICLHLLHYRQEIVPAEGIAPPMADGRKEIQAVARLIEELAGPFDPEVYPDPYQERVRAFLREKQEQQGTVTAPEPEVAEEEEFVDLMQALEESMERARARRRHAA